LASKKPRGARKDTSQMVKNAVKNLFSKVFAKLILAFSARISTWS